MQAYIDRATVIRLDLLELGYDAPTADTLLLPAFINGLHIRYGFRVAHLNPVCEGMSVVCRRLREVTINMPLHKETAGAASVAQAEKKRQRKKRRRETRHEKRTCYKCGKQGHIAVNCPSGESGGSHALMAQGAPLPPQPPAEQFIMDSGASHNIVHDATWLTNQEVSATPDVVLGGGERHTVTCQGSLRVRALHTGQFVTFTNVLCVPTIEWKLISAM